MRRPVLAFLCLSMAAASATADDRRTETIAADALALRGLIGTVRVDTGGSGPIRIVVSGAPEAVRTVQVRKDGETAIVEQTHTRHGTSWFDLAWLESDHDDQLKVDVEILAPRATHVTGDKLIGDLFIGDLDAPLVLRVLAVNGEVGRVTSADIEIAGAGDLSVGAVEGAARLSIKGGGDVRIGSAGGAEVNIAGAGDVALGDVSGPFSASIAGGGDVKTGAVNGPVSISIAGTGDVSIASGRADPFSVSIVGAGSVDFGGEAVNPQISAVGSGDVRMRSYTGNLHSSGMVSVRTGD